MELTDIMLAEDSAIAERVLIRLVEWFALWGDGSSLPFGGARPSSWGVGGATAVGEASY